MLLGSYFFIQNCLNVFGVMLCPMYCFFDTYFPIAKLTTIFLLLAIAFSQFWHLHQLDVHNAFLHGNLYEEVYMQFHSGNSTTRPNQSFGKRTYRGTLGKNNNPKEPVFYVYASPLTRFLVFDYLYDRQGEMIDYNIRNIVSRVLLYLCLVRLPSSAANCHRLSPATTVDRYRLPLITADCHQPPLTVAVLR
ncbi:hypothetical protein CR513_10446, partial [Mucuna pruriens]